MTHKGGVKKGSYVGPVASYGGGMDPRTPGESARHPEITLNFCRWGTGKEKTS